MFSGGPDGTVYGAKVNSHGALRFKNMFVVTAKLISSCVFNVSCLATYYLHLFVLGKIQMDPVQLKYTQQWHIHI